MREELKSVDSLQKTQSVFRELRERAGFKTVHALAWRLRVRSLRRVYNWDAGGVPPYRDIRRLAKAFGIEESECIELLWNETVGSLCECGCRGEKVRPAEGGARRLYIKTRCKRCGCERTHRPQARHRKFGSCRACFNRTRPKRIRLTCVGYRFHDSAQQFARRCPRVKEFYPSYLTYHFRHKSDNQEEQHGFADVTRGEYRCGWCAGALRMLSGSEKRAKELFQQMAPATNVPRIRTRKDFEELCRKVFLARGMQAGKAKGSKPGYTVPYDRAHARFWRRKDPEKFPPAVRGLCYVCDKLLLSHNGVNPAGQPIRFHQKCLLNYLSENHGRVPPKKSLAPGRQRSIESLQKKFAWTVRHKVLHDSLGDIAADFSVTREAIRQAVADIRSLLPPPEDVPAYYRELVRRCAI